MPIIEPPSQYEPGLGLGRPLRFSGAPAAGTSAVQTIGTATGAITAGTFRLGFRGFFTPALPANLSAANTQTALESLPTIGSGNVACTGGALPTTPVVVTFQNVLKNQPLEPIQVDNSALVGGTLGVTNNTTGVRTTGANAPKGAYAIDTTNAIAYINTGTPAAPAWTKTGTQTLDLAPMGASAEEEGEEEPTEEPTEDAAEEELTEEPTEGAAKRRKSQKGPPEDKSG